MKRYYLLIGVVAVAALWAGGVFLWSWLSPIPTPPTPGPIEASVIGPSTARVGELVVLASSNSAKNYRWLSVPSGPQLKFMEDGKVLVVVFDKPGNYTIVLGLGSDGGIDACTHLISVGGEGPDPPRPPPGPEPAPPTPDTKEWEEWSYKQGSGKQHAAELAEGLKSLAAQIDAGAIKDMAEARVLWRSKANEILGKDAAEWVEFSNAFRDRCLEQEKSGWLYSLEQQREIYVAVAAGLSRVVKVADNRAIMVVITSDGCLPCEALKSQYLSKARSLGEVRIIMLDKTKDVAKVDKYATKGMKGMVVVPQVHIQRYVNGRWWQWSHTGYTNYNEMDQWVKAVFSQEVE